MGFPLCAFNKWLWLLTFFYKAEGDKQLASFTLYFVVLVLGDFWPMLKLEEVKSCREVGLMFVECGQKCGK